MSQLPPLTVFDIETTGLDPRRGHRIIEIAGVRVANGTLTGQTFTSFVNPERAIPLEARQVNRIRDEDVATAPTIDVVLPKFLEFASGSVLIAHNAQFDFGFLLSEKEYCWGYVELPECLCTRKLSESLYPKDFRHSLDVLMQRFALSMKGDRHRALTDSILTAEALVKMIDAGKISSLEDLRKKASIGQLV